MNVTAKSAIPSVARPSPSVVRTHAPAVRHGIVALIPDLRIRARKLARCEATADDLVQDTIERALRFAVQYEGGTNLRAWMQQILFSVFITLYRKQKREKRAFSRLSEDHSAWTFRDPFAAEATPSTLTSTTAAKLASLPAGYCAVIQLVDVESKSYRDAACTLQVPVGTVMSRLHRGRKLLAGLMQREAA
jgi:RNA polymerase sigma-70 factor, ECF subfamily